MTVSGIYLIENSITKDSYVGKTKSLGGRWTGHLLSMTNGKHANVKMQEIYNKTSIESFVFSVLELCDVPDLDIREKYWIDRIHPTINILGNTGLDVDVVGLARLRVMAGLTLIDVSNVLNTGWGYIEAIEKRGINGKQQRVVRNRIKLAELYGCSVEDIVAASTESKERYEFLRQAST